MKTVIAIALMLSATIASADQFKTVTKDLSSKKYEASISFPKLLKNSVPGHAAINKHLENLLVEDGCGAEDAAESEYGYDYFASARIVALNKSYVGYEISGNQYCGGAHPNYYSYNMTYDAQTGAPVDMDKEVPAQFFDIGNYDWEAYQAHKKALAEIVYNNLDKADLTYTDEATINDCIAVEDGKQTALENIEMMSPSISGYAKNKQVIINTSPAHAMAACQFTVRVPFSEVERFFAKDSKAAKWLK